MVNLNFQASKESLKNPLIPWAVNNVAQAVDDTAQSAGLVMKPLSSAINNALTTVSNPQLLVDKGTYKKILPFLGWTLAHELAMTLKLPFASIDKWIEYFISQNLDRIWESIKWVTTWGLKKLLQWEDPSQLRKYTLGLLWSVIWWAWDIATSIPKLPAKVIHFPFEWINGKLVPLVESTTNTLDQTNLWNTSILTSSVLTSNQDNVVDFPKRETPWITKDLDDDIKKAA